MIARIWKGETPESKADQYFDFLKVTGILSGMIVGSVGKIRLSLRNNTQQSPGSSNQG